MSEIPEGIMQRAIDAWPVRPNDPLSSQCALEAMAFAIMAERERCAQIADEHALRCSSKIGKKRTDYDNGLFESAAYEAMSIAASIRSTAVKDTTDGQ